MADSKHFIQFRKILLDETGILIHEDDKWPMLSEKLNQKEIESFLQSPTKNISLWNRIYDILNISETYFFRDPNQLTAIFDNILPLHWKYKKGMHVSIWSAGCSKGEEAYTLAILIELYRKNRNLDFTYSVLGSDLQESSIQFAEEGFYTSYSVRADLPPSFKPYLENHATGYRVSSEIKKNVVFNVKNLLHPDSAGQTFDLIVCRNVLIYLDEASKANIFTQFSSSLNEGGILVLGHSEFHGKSPNSLGQHFIPNKTSYFLYTENPLTGSGLVSSYKEQSVSVSRTPPREITRVEADKLKPRGEQHKDPISEIASDDTLPDSTESLKQELYENPEQIRAYYELANHYWENGDRLLARRYQAQARKVFNNDPGLTDSLKRNGDWLVAWDEFLSEDI